MRFHTVLAVLVAAATIEASPTNSSSHQHTDAILKDAIRVETHLSTGYSLDMVSSLIIGSEAAILIDLPLAIPQARALAAWVKNTTDKPLVAAFTTHFHPDHYLSGAAFFESFPNTSYYASSSAVALIQNEAHLKSDYWVGIYGPEIISTSPVIPTPYDFSFFTLPNDEESPIMLLNPVGGDTIDETLFWIPSISTLIAGDSVYSNELHLWMADLLTPELTESWLSTLDFIANLKPNTIIPGHALTNGPFTTSKHFNHTRSYVEYWQSDIESRGANYYTPVEISKALNSTFPGLTASMTSATLLNITAENFGRNGSRQIHYLDLTSYNNTQALTGWSL